MLFLAASSSALLWSGTVRQKALEVSVRPLAHAECWWSHGRWIFVDLVMLPFSRQCFSEYDIVVASSSMPLKCKVRSSRSMPLKRKSEVRWCVCLCLSEHGRDGRSVREHAICVHVSVNARVRVCVCVSCVCARVSEVTHASRCPLGRVCV